MEFGHRLSFYKIQENAELKFKRYAKDLDDESNLINVYIVLDFRPRRVLLRCTPTMTVRELITRIELMEGIPPDQQRLIFNN